MPPVKLFCGVLSMAARAQHATFANFLHHCLQRASAPHHVAHIGKLGTRVDVVKVKRARDAVVPTRLAAE